MIADEDYVLGDKGYLPKDVKKGIRGASNDKLMLFNPNAITQINYRPGCHQADPMGNIIMCADPELKMLHYKYNGLADFLPKQKSRGERLSKFNKEHGMGMYYLMSEQEHRDEYKTFIEKRVKVL